MKAIMISIKPEWVAKILNGEKTIEIRKTLPKCDLPIDVYIYCTKGNPIGKFGDGLYHEITKDSHWSNGCSWNMPKIYLEGKVVAKFTLNNVEEIKQWHQPADSNCYNDYDNWEYETESLDEEELGQKCCLASIELYEYLGNNISGYTKVGYAWHISNLEIFDQPKELSEFGKCQLLWNCVPHNCQECPALVRLTKAPQSWYYIEVI